MSNNGFGFKEIGYTVTTSNTYDASNNSITNIKQNGIDIANYINQCGVFMLNGSNSSYVIYPIYCTMNLSVLQYPINTDDGYLVYPGWGLQLFYSTNGSTSSSYSNIYYNTSSSPRTFWLSGNTLADNIIKIFNTTTSYSGNQTDSLRIYYRGNEVKINNLSF